MLKTRVLTALIVAPVLVFVMAYGGLPYKILLALAGFAGVLEMSLMFFRKLEERLYASLCSALAATLLVVLIFEETADYSLFLFTASFLLIAALSVYTSQNAEDAYSRMGRGMIMIYYVPILVWFVYMCREIDTTDSYAGWEPTILLFGVTWLTDTGAYFTGRAFGKTPLAPKLSPKKTVEGLIGGAAFSVIFAVLFALFLYPGLHWALAALLGAVASFWGQTGDLVESLFKRVAKVKDSGKILPGHGGMLDRIDALLFNAPLVYFMLKAFS